MVTCVSSGAWRPPIAIPMCTGTSPPMTFPLLHCPSLPHLDPFPYLGGGGRGRGGGRAGGGGGNKTCIHTFIDSPPVINWDSLCS